MLAATMLLGHETQLAKEEGWDESVLVMRLVTIRDGVLAEIGGFDYFTDVLIETDFEMRTSDKDRVLDTALERSGYNATRSRLFPPGTEIVEYTEDGDFKWWPRRVGCIARLVCPSQASFSVVC